MFHGRKRVALTVPAIEVPDQGNGLRGGCPLADAPLLLRRVEVNSYKLMASGVGGERFRARLDAGERGGKLRHPSLNRSLVRL